MPFFHYFVTVSSKIPSHIYIFIYGSKEYALLCKALRVEAVKRARTTVSYNNNNHVQVDTKLKEKKYKQASEKEFVSPSVKVGKGIKKKEEKQNKQQKSRLDFQGREIYTRDRQLERRTVN